MYSSYWFTFPVNVSYPDDENFDILDMGEGARTYSLELHMMNLLIELQRWCNGNE